LKKETVEASGKRENGV